MSQGGNLETTRDDDFVYNFSLEVALDGPLN